MWWSMLPVCVACLSIAAGPPRAGGEGGTAGRHAAPERPLAKHLLVTWYGNPHTGKMGILGRASGVARADALRRQAAAYATLTDKRIVPAYHLVAVVAQPAAGADRMWRRRESGPVIRALLAEARQYGFKLILDVQIGRSSVDAEVACLEPFLAEPDVYLALDPEFAMGAAQVPGRHLGRMRADEINAAIGHLERIVTARRVPPKVLIVHQFTLAMLPDKERIRSSALVDLVLTMDGFGSQALKLASYRAVMRQRRLDFAGIKLFFQQDTGLFSPEQVMRLNPAPSVVVYQ